MELVEKTKLPSGSKTKKIRDNGSNQNLWMVFFFVSFPPALVLTIVFWLLDIKTPFWSERGTSHYPWFRGYITVFFFFTFYIASAIVILYILSFLLKSLVQKKTKAGKYILLFLSDQLLFIFFLFLLWKERSRNSAIILLSIFLSIILNSFFIHYFFSKPAMKLLIEKYPYYFPKFFYQETKLIMKVDGLEFKKSQTTEWAIIITLILVNFWILSLLFFIWYSKR